MRKLLYLLLFVLSLHFISFGQNSSAVPLEGEGIHAFLRRNNYSGNENFKKFIDLNQGKFGKDQSLVLGVSYLLPTSEETTEISFETGKEPLFGDALAEYTIKSDRLKGACFFLASGHGGPDPGAITKVDNQELHEDEYAYDIMLRLALNLLKEGATVHIIIQDAKDGIRDDKYLKNSTRETCVGDKIPLSQNKRLQQRCNKINNLSQKSKEKYQRALFIHLDSRGKNLPVDIFFYHWVKSPKGKQLANTLRETVHKKYDQNQPNRGFSGTVSSRNLHVLRTTNPVGVFLELGNICNDGRDRKRFLDYNNRQAIANWLRDGLVNDYNNNNNNNK